LLDDDWRIKITDFGSAKVVDPITLEPVELPEGPYGVLQSRSCFSKLTSVGICYSGRQETVVRWDC
jgi:hypothetical protein